MQHRRVAPHVQEFPLPSPLNILDTRLNHAARQWRQIPISGPPVLARVVAASSSLFQSAPHATFRADVYQDVACSAPCLLQQSFKFVSCPVIDHLCDILILCVTISCHQSLSHHLIRRKHGHGEHVWRGRRSGRQTGRWSRAISSGAVVL